MFEIKKDIPVPPVSERGVMASKSRYPFRHMEVGDCFDAPRDMPPRMFGPEKKYKKDGRQHSIYTAARLFAKYHKNGFEFCTKLLDDNTVRCWRTA